MTQVKARILPEDTYAWYKYTGKGVTVGSPRQVDLQTGDVFGARKSTSGKQIRVVTKKEGVNKVYTVPYDQAKKIGKNCTLVKKAKNPVESDAQAFQMMAMDRLTFNVGNALLKGLRALDPGITKVKQTDTGKGMQYIFKISQHTSLNNITKTIADIAPHDSAVHGKNEVVFTIDTPYGVQYEEEFQVTYNEQEPDARLIQVLHKD